MKRLFKNLFGGPKSNTQARKGSVRLGVEALEDRQLLSVTAVFSGDPYNGGLLKITSNSASDHIVLIDRANLYGDWFLEVQNNHQHVDITGDSYLPNGYAQSFSLRNYSI